MWDIWEIYIIYRYGKCLRALKSSKGAKRNQEYVKIKSPAKIIVRRPIKIIQIWRVTNLDPHSFV